MYCSNCGKKNPKDSKFCQHCGIKMSTSNKIEGLKEEKSKNNWHLLWKVPLVIIGSCILVFMLLYVFSSSFRNGFNNGYNGTNTNTTNSSNSNSTTDVNSWISYSPDSNQFTVMLPSYPLHKVDKTDSGESYDTYTTSTDNENTGYFIEVYSVSPNTDTDSFLESMLDGMVQGIGNDAKITYRNYSYVGSDRSLDAAITTGNLTMVVRLIYDSNKGVVFALLDSYYTSTPDDAGFKKFFTSFTIN